MADRDLSRYKIMASYVVTIPTHAISLFSFSIQYPKGHDSPGDNAEPM